MNIDRMYKAGGQSAASLCITSEKREGSYGNQGLEACKAFALLSVTLDL
jgi:hypothetical protein